MALATGALAASLAFVLPARAATAKPTVVVKFGEYFYRPAVVTVSVGQKVSFVNVGKIGHTVADSTKRGQVLSRLIKPHELKPGARQTVTFMKKGTVYYICTFHPTLMHGTIIVR